MQPALPLSPTAGRRRSPTQPRKRLTAGRGNRSLRCGSRKPIVGAMNPPIRALALAVALGACMAFAASEPGDPARWYQPVERPRQKYDNAMIEARQALLVALSECKKYGEQKACEAAARDQYKRDVQY